MVSAASSRRMLQAFAKVNKDHAKISAHAGQGNSFNRFIPPGCGRSFADPGSACAPRLHAGDRAFL